jgi:membrane protein
MTRFTKKAWSVIKKVWGEIETDRVEMMAGSVAFFGTLSLFPAVAALVLVYGLFADPTQLEAQLTWMAQSLVPLARDVLHDSLEIAGHERTSFGVGALSALALAIYGASRATNAILLSIRVAHGEPEDRGFFAQLALNFTFTLCALVSVGLILIPFAAAPGIMTRLGVPDGIMTLIVALRWPAIWLGFFVAVMLLYRWAPKKTDQNTPLALWPGALLSTIGWTLVSFGFSFYAARLGGYAGTYGPAAAFAIFMTWLYLTAFIIIVGAEFNSELRPRGVKAHRCDWRVALRSAEPRS